MGTLNLTRDDCPPLDAIRDSVINNTPLPHLDECDVCFDFVDAVEDWGEISAPKTKRGGESDPEWARSFANRLLEGSWARWLVRSL